VDAERVLPGEPPLMQRERFDSFDALRTLAEPAPAELSAELERARRVMDDLQSSLSWRITAPLRAAKRALP
jgi:hypothetical protein